MTSPSRRPAPEFRPPAKRGGRRSGPRVLGSRDRRTFAIVAAMAVLLIGAVAAGAFLLLRDDDGPTISGGGSQDGREPQLEGPASRYVPQLSEAPIGTEVFPPGTFGMTALQFAVNGPFESPQEGEETALRWGFMDGYQVEFQPVNLLADVVQGKYYVHIEAYMFETQQGAREAYDMYETVYAGITGSERLDDVAGLGNQSSAWQKFEGTVANSELRQVFHRFVFRRGNLVAVVQTTGAEPFMTIDRARELAVYIDEKGLGQRPSPSPTPRPTATP